VVAAAMSFVLEYALGGATPMTASGLGGVAAVMAGTHVLIGLGEGLITATTVVTVAKTRPDLVYALRRFPAPAARRIETVRSAA
jgi:cobalt/nickel transport system permease protein